MHRKRRLTPLSFLRRAAVALAALAIGWALGASAPAARAAEGRDGIPPPLQPWIPWVLHGHEEAFCPVLGQKPQPEDGTVPPIVRACLWPSRLDLDLGDRGGQFRQEWQVYRGAWVALPGDARSWPQDVRVDGRSTPLTAPGGVPSVRLAPGRHRVEGRFLWPSLPPILPVPADSALVGLTVRGRAVPFPVRDAEGRVWLEKRAGAEEEESRLDIAVHRLFDDEVPPVLITRVELRVSGRSREVDLGAPLPPGFAPMSLSGPLPARLAPGGRLLAQVRAGTWTIELRARHDGPVDRLAPPPRQGNWPAEEIWVVQTHPAIRVVKIEGAQAIDPQQTTLPDEWRSLPAYLMRSGDALTIAEVQRGDADPAPDRLTLTRRMWLDFDGGGFTAHDRILGRFHRSWRLEMPAPGVLGRVTIDGVDQLITRGQDAGTAGVEIRQGEANIQADSRVPRDGALPATGWDAEFQSAQVDVMLPPGWRLLHASGADATSKTWVASWNLLDFFLVLLISMGVARLFGWGTLWLALAGLAISWIEPGAPRWTWAAAVATTALARALPAGRMKHAARLLQGAALVTLLPILIPFLALQARSAMYPALEPPMSDLAGLGPGGIGETTIQEYDTVAGDVARESLQMRALPEGVPSSRPAAPPVSLEELKSLGYVSNLAADPKAAAQTGPGLPDWRWRSARLVWSGPVDPSQTIRLWLLPRWLNFLIAWGRVALLTALLLLLVAGAAREWGATLRPGPLDRFLKAFATVLVAAFLPLGAPEARAADVPSSEALDALRERLLEPPDCLPDCVSFPRLALEADPDRLRLRLELHAATLAAAPLPGGVDQWLPARAVLDGAPAALRRDGEGRLWIALPAGTHQVILEGALPDRDAVPISLPLAPREVTARATGWRVEGLQEGRLAEGTLQLSRVRAASARAQDSSETLAPFVRVTRRLELGLRWQMTTEVTRLTPAGTAVLIEVPLLPGESVTSGDQPVVGDRAIVRLGPQSTGTQWTSVLLVKPEVTLRAPQSVPWTEIWVVAVGPAWHLETQGPPPIHGDEAVALRARTWRPWPGEEVRLAVTRPAAVEGRTLTFERTTLTITPGVRATDAVLELSARASRGGEQTLTLPDGAVLGALAIQNRSQPFRQEGRKVALPIVPGAQTIRLEWREPRGLSASFRAAEVDPGIGTTNATTIVALPSDRWILFLRGPRLGPAVLFWSLLAIALIAALLLGAVRSTPLRWQHWFGLSFGLTQVPIVAGLVIAAWLVALGARSKRAARNKWWFDLGQVGLAFWTLLALGLLFWAVQHGLLGRPEMQISGNGSSAGHLDWYQDRTETTLPQPWAFSVPILYYRLAMLAWALWLAAALLRWLRWGWEAFSEGGVWKPLRSPKPPPQPPPLPVPQG